MSKLLLFDIDGTLITTDSAGRHALELSFMECIGKDISQVDFNLCGRTDKGIITELLERFNIDINEEIIDSIIYYYLEFLPYELEIAQNAFVFKGVLPLLETLINHNNYKLALLTGNIEDGAYKKLDYFGLKKFFNTGGFGDDHIDRNEIFPIAYKRCVRFFEREFAKNDIIVIGDSPKDIECAVKNGLKSLIVGTGLSDNENLFKLKPTAFIKDFSNLENTMKLLGSI